MIQTLRVKDLLAALEHIASFALAAGWDNVGLMAGNPDQMVSGVLLGLDPTEELLAEARQHGCNVLITHHPLIFHPLRTVRTDQPAGRFLQQALAAEITVIGCHTNLDVAAGGVSDALAAALGLEKVRPLAAGVEQLSEQAAEQGHTGPSPGFGRCGQLPVPVSGPVFLSHLHVALDQPVLAVAGRLPEWISTVAVCGGSGSELAEAALWCGAQVFITGEVKHSVARWAEASGFCVIDAGHFATENPVVPKLAGLLTAAFTGKGQKVLIRATERQANPFTFHHAPERR